MAEETHPGFRDEPRVLPVVVRPNPAGTLQSPRILLVDYDPWILEKLGCRLMA